MRASVIIPHGGGAHLLRSCLASLRRQSERDFETIVVDNQTRDESLSVARAEFPEVRVVRLAWNGVFAGAVNAGLRIARGTTIALLNNDAEADEHWLGRLLDRLDAYPEASFAASKILLWDRRDTLHSAADYYGLDGIPGNRGVWQIDRGQYDQDLFVPGACGGAAAYRRELLSDLGLFDDGLVAYCEDVDLNLRALLAGHRCVFAPEARVYHRLSATGGGPFASYSCGRNFVVVAARNLPGPLLRRHAGRIIGAQLRLAADSARHLGEPAARARLRGQIAGLRALPRAIAARTRIHSRTRRSWREVERVLELGDRPTSP